MSTNKRHQRMVYDNQLAITLPSSDLAFHMDILSQILVRLPIRSLTRFKSVSKHWLYLISSPQFLRLRNPNPNPTSLSGLVLRRNTIKVTEPAKYDFVSFEPTLDYDPDMWHLGTVIHSCNGLFYVIACGNAKTTSLRKFTMINFLFQSYI